MLNQYVLSQQKLSHRQVRWVEILAEYAMNFIYKPERVHSAPDALFRILALKIDQMLQAAGKRHRVGGRVVSIQHAQLCDYALLEAVH